jgi:exosortase A-associated hydrolase 1
MTYTEETALFACAGDTLLGILAKPEIPAETGVVVIVGGPQYRVGSHRQFVLLSHALAAAGYAVLRFDYRGMGDSTGAQSNFESVSADIAAAIDALQARLPAVKQVALWGLCDGASAALLYCHQTYDPRVTGMCLLNPWVRSEISLARTQVKHYYAQRLMQKEFWLKLLGGQVALSALSGFIQKIRLSATASTAGAQATHSPGSAPFQQRMAAAWHNFSGHILLLLSGDDYTAKEFLEHAQSDVAWKNYLGHAKLTRHDIADVDHTFSNATSRKLAEDATINWLTQQNKPSKSIQAKS